MAQETLVNGVREFAESVRGFIARLNSVKGPLYLAALAQFEGQAQWALLVGSHTLFGNLYDEMKGLIELMDRHLPAEHRKRIAKVGIVGPDDPFFRAISRTLRIENQPGFTHFQDCRINDIIVQNAWIFLSSSTVADQRAAEKQQTRPAKLTRQKRR